MHGAGLNRFLRPALLVAFLAAALLAAVACIQSEPPPAEITIAPLPTLEPGWASRLAHDIQTITGENSETLAPRIELQKQEALSLNTNPAVDALLREIVALSTSGPGDPMHHLGLALDIVGRIEGTGTVEITPETDGLLILDGGRHPYVAEATAGVPVTFEAVPRYASLPMTLAMDTGCTFFTVDASKGFGSVVVPAPARPESNQADILEASINPISGPGTTVIEFNLSATRTRVRLLAWSPQIGRGVRLNRSGRRNTGEYALPALEPGVIEWQFEALGVSCRRGKSLTVEFDVTS